MNGLRSEAVQKTQQAAGEKQNTSGKHDILPDGNGKDGVIRDKRIKQSDAQKYKRSQTEGFQGADQVGNGKSHKTHLE